MFGAVVVAQLAKRSLPTPEVLVSNPVIGKVFIDYCLLSTVFKSRKKEKRPGKKYHLLFDWFELDKTSKTVVHST